MAKTITQLPDATAVNDADELIIQQGGVTKRATAQELRNHSGDITIGDKIIHNGDTNTSIRFPAADTVTVETAGTERMRVSSAGAVSIGNSTIPSNTNLYVYDSDTLAAVRVESAGADGFASLVLKNDAQTYALQIQGTDADKLYIYDTTNAAARMTITTAGNVGIATTTPATPLHVDGTIRYTNRPAAGTITAIGFDTNGDLKASSSSLRYKENVSPYTKGLSEVAQLDPVTFNYSGENILNAGLIVEDLDQKGFEEFVLRDAEGNADAIPYANMVVLLINAVKELKQRVEALEQAS